MEAKILLKPEAPLPMTLVNSLYSMGFMILVFLLTFMGMITLENYIINYYFLISHWPKRISINFET